MHDSILSRNRANAQKSTGPKTEDGKARSSLNRLDHGLAGRFRLLPGESQEDYTQLQTSLDCEWNPQHATEQILVTQMAEAHWKLRRIGNWQDGILQKCPNPFDPDIPAEVSKRMMLLQRYEVSERRAFHKGMEDLRRLQNERRKPIEEENRALSNALDELYLNTEDEVNDSKPHRVNEAKSKASTEEVVARMSAKLEKLAAGLDPEAGQALLAALHPEKEATESGDN